MGTAERKDIWEDQIKAAQVGPGAGAYLQDTSTLSKKGVAIGLPREEKIESRPGPGEYEFDPSHMIRGTQGSVRIGTEQRKDLFSAEIKKAAEQPAPGTYEKESTFGKGHHASIGLPREHKIEAKPGPGEYDFDSSMDLRTNKASVRIGTAERKDIWED
jgi:hypothetical protein